MYLNSVYTYMHVPICICICMCACIGCRDAAVPPRGSEERTHASRVCKQPPTLLLYTRGCITVATIWLACLCTQPSTAVLKSPRLSQSAGQPACCALLWFWVSLITTLLHRTVKAHHWAILTTAASPLLFKSTTLHRIWPLAFPRKPYRGLERLREGGKAPNKLH